MYLPRHFQAYELVPPAIFANRKDKSFELIDERVLITLDTLRDTFGPCTINDWYWKGHFEQSGLRTSDVPKYSPTSQHTFGRAMDCKFKEQSAADVRHQVIQNRLLFPYITFMEDDVDWFHFDVRNGERIVLWSPVTDQSRLV
ncbi:hypothetical protein [Endozoicomonas sp. YOMI1]|uniref:hypothetical protein n=1 Tax=Endozoicomonas sp. YOMI1 TaxID=2828739 RepID=UPI002147B197|nr:hypothetical protein [Endozoicomonas sp. YOMI1]